MQTVYFFSSYRTSITHAVTCSDPSLIAKYSLLLRHRQPRLHRRARLDLLKPLAQLRERRQIDARPRRDANPPERLDVREAVCGPGEVLGFLECRFKNGVEAFGFVKVAVDGVGTGREGGRTDG
jgi:hypothetical protein